jgi:hypothetical protein
MSQFRQTPKRYVGGIFHQSTPTWVTADPNQPRNLQIESITSNVQQFGGSELVLLNNALGATPAPIEIRFNMKRGLRNHA